MLLNLIQAVSLRTTRKAFVRVPIQELGREKNLSEMWYRPQGRTHPSYETKTRTTTLRFGILRKAQRIFGNAKGESSIRTAAEGSAPKHQFVCTNTKRPPINGVSVAALVENLWSHI